jgi:hypothetical protein
VPIPDESQQKRLGKTGIYQADPHGAATVLLVLAGKGTKGMIMYANSSTSGLGGEEIGLADDGPFLGVHIQVVVRVFLLRLEYFEPDEFSLGKRLLKLHSTVLLRLYLRNVLVAFDGNLHSVVLLATENLEILFGEQFLHSFLFTPEQLEMLLLLVLGSEDGCLLILRFLASLGKGMFSRKMLRLFVQIMR